MANRFWVGGTAAWTGSANSWASTSGGAGGAGIPTASDDVFLDSSSGSGTVTVSSAAVCRSLNCTGFTGTLAGGSGITIGDATAGASNVALKLVSGMTFSHGGLLTFASTSATQQTVDSGGKTLNNITVSGTGGNYVLAANLTQGSGNTFTHTRATWATNGFAWSFGSITNTGSNARTLDITNSTVTVTGSSGTIWNTGGQTNLTLISTGSTLVIANTGAATVSFSSLAYNNVTWNSANNLTWNGTAQFNTVTLQPTGTLPIFFMGGSSTINTALTVAGPAVNKNLFFQSSTLGAQRTITFGGSVVPSLTDVTFSDQIFTGTAAPYAGTRVGDAGNNSGITFTTPRNVYRIGDGGNWSDLAWATSSGGTPGATVFPLMQDTAILDANTLANNSTIVMDKPRLPNIDVSGLTKVATFDLSSQTSYSMYGSLVWSATKATSTGTNTVTYYNDASITSNGGSLGTWSPVTSPRGGKTLSLNDNLVTSGTLGLTNSTFQTNGHNVTTASVSLTSANTRTISMGAGTWTLTGTGTVWDATTTTGLTLNPSTSTIAITDTSSTAKTFIGGGQTYNNLSVTGGGTGSLTFTGANSFGTLTLGSPKTVIFPASTTTTVSGFSAIGSLGNLITIQSSSSGTAATLSKGSGIVSCDYLSLKDSAATGGAKWYAGANSTNVSGNSGWVFSSAANPNFFQFFN